jgi:methionyl-tRNA formyltransferase
MARALAALSRGALSFTPQPQEGVTYAHKITPEDRVLDWGRSAVELDRVVRALSPHLGARTVIDDTPLVVWRARPLAGDSPPRAIRPPLTVGCADGELELIDVQPAGKRRMPAADYVRGLRTPPRMAA